jgi:hypothetical protein
MIEATRSGSNFANAAPARAVIKRHDGELAAVFILGLAEDAVDASHLDVAMAAHDALGKARGARGEDDGRHLVVVDRNHGLGRRAIGDERQQIAFRLGGFIDDHAQIQGPNPAGRHFVFQGSIENKNPAVEEFERAGNLHGGPFGIENHGNGAEPVDAIERDHVLHGIFRQNGNMVPLGHPTGGEMMGEPIGPLIESG